MTDWKVVNGSQEVKPVEFDMESSPTTVYQRRNITTVEIENEDGSKTTQWQYEERQMTKDECIKYQHEELEKTRADIDFIAAMTDVEL